MLGWVEFQDQNRRGFMVRVQSIRSLRHGVACCAVGISGIKDEVISLDAYVVLRERIDAAEREVREWALMSRRKVITGAKDDEKFEG